MVDSSPWRECSEDAFLLTRQHYDGADGIEIVLWARGESGPVRLRFPGQEAVCFQHVGALDPAEVGARSRSVALEALDGGAVEALYFPTQRALKDAKRIARDAGVRWYESDIKPADRFLMERFVTASFRVEGEAREHAGFREYRAARITPGDYRPDLKLVSIDIETGGFDEDLYSVAVSSAESAHVFLVRADSWDVHHVGERLTSVSHSVHADERTALEELFAWVAHEDPDVLIGWNVIDFDLRFLERACDRWNLGFSLGRGGERARLLRPSGLSGRRVARIPGRAVLDGIDVLRTATWSFEDFALGAVASELLGRTKLIEEESQEKVEKIRTLYRDEPWELVRYNLEDCRLVEDVFEHAGLVGFALERAELTGLAFDRPGGAVAAFDNLYLPRLHRHGRVAPDVTSGGDEPSPGGFVMDSRPGLFDNVVVLDFKSLYPSIIRTFLVDPLGLALGDESPDDAVPGFRGARFSRTTHVLPELIERLWSARDTAKAANDDALSRAIKIIMNSFYGVLGTDACRFYEPRLASSITLRGHEIIRQSREFLEEQGRPVLYGDTDSLFVKLEDGASEAICRAEGEGLARDLTSHWSRKLRDSLGLESHLELEFEKHFLKFFMPTVRGSEVGSKKRYSGLVRRGDALEVSFTGLEAVRSDWTPLARRFQREVYRRVFHGEPVEDYVKSIAGELFEGLHDDDLVYRKRLRRKLEDYVKNVPPHVQAARKSPRPGRFVRYVITTVGPEPLDARSAPLDYQHYLDRQLAPAADAILHVLGTSVDKILDAQMSLF